MTREQRLERALYLMEFHEGSARPEFAGAQPTVRINGEDFSEVLGHLRAALSTPADAPCSTCGNGLFTGSTTLGTLCLCPDCVPADAPAPAEQEVGRCTALDHLPRCNQPPVPGTNTCWAHGGDLIAKTAPPPRPDEDGECPACGGRGYVNVVADPARLLSGDLCLACGGSGRGE